MRVVPPMTRGWFEILPPPFNVEQPVIVVMLPADWRLSEGTTKDEEYNVLVALSPDEEKLVGLQLVDVELGRYMDQREKFREYGVPMADPTYIGPLSTLPNELLLDETVCPMIFSRDQMWKRPIDLRRCWRKPPASC